MLIIFFLVSGKSFNKGKEVRGGEILNNFSLMKQFEWNKRLFQKKAANEYW